MSSILITLLISIMLYPTFSLYDDNYPEPIVMNCSHVNSMDSPFCNPNSTMEQQDTYMMERISYRWKSVKSGAELDSYRVPIVESVRNKNQTPSVFLAQVILEPRYAGRVSAVENIGSQDMVDTGGKYPWLFCALRGLKSGIYNRINSQDERCMGAKTPQPMCYTDDGSCYFMKAWDGSISAGFPVEDNISLIGHPDCSTTTIFGCAINLENRDEYGSILAPSGNISVMSQWGHKEFSYDLRYVNNFKASGLLLLGSDYSHSQKYETTLEVVGSQYYVTIKGKQVETQYHIPIIYGLNVVMDIGASVTYLPLDLVVLIENYVMKKGKYFRTVMDDDHRLCYVGNLLNVTDMVPYPYIVLRYSDGVNFQIILKNPFRQIRDGVVCLAILPSKTEHTIIGAITQQDFAIQYFLEDMTLIFEYFDCDSLRR